ncbi:MAG: RNA methyltransferase [Mycobacteriaceae bacterium]
MVAAVKLHRPAARRAAGRFLVEGTQAVREALACAPVVEVFATDEALIRNAELLAGARAAGVTVSTVTDRAAAALSETVTPQGLVAVCPLLDTAHSQVLAGRPRTVAVLVDASEPGNAGTVIRVADAAGADVVVLAGDSVDVHNGKCVRASAGSVFHLPVARRRDVSGLVGWLRSAGLQVLATAADGELDLDSADEILAAPTAWLFGNEAHGLAPALAAQADHRVRVPIHGRAESLNLAAAAAVCLYAGARVHHLGS